jgi:hypothetical protein
MSEGTAQLRPIPSRRKEGQPYCFLQSKFRRNITELYTNTVLRVQNESRWMGGNRRMMRRRAAGFLEPCNLTPFPPVQHVLDVMFARHQPPRSKFLSWERIINKAHRTQTCDCYVRLEMYSNVKLDSTAQHSCVGSAFLGGRWKVSSAVTRRIPTSFLNYCHVSRGGPSAGTPAIKKI